MNTLEISGKIDDIFRIIAVNMETLESTLHESECSPVMNRTQEIGESRASRKRQAAVWCTQRVVILQKDLVAM